MGKEWVPDYTHVALKDIPSVDERERERVRRRDRKARERGIAMVGGRKQERTGEGAIAVVATMGIDKLIRAIFKGEYDKELDEGSEAYELAKKRCEVAKLVAQAQLFDRFPELMEFSRRLLSEEGSEINTAQVEFAKFVLGRLLPSEGNRDRGGGKEIEMIARNWFGDSGEERVIKGKSS